MSPSLEEHKGFLPSVNNSVDRPFTGGVLSSTQYACTQYSVVLSMPVLSSPIGFLYFLVLISSEPVAIGPPLASTGNRRQPPAKASRATFFGPKWVLFLIHFLMNFRLHNGLQSGPKTGPKVVKFGIHLCIPFL